MNAALRQRMYDLGLVFPVSSGIQIDLTPAFSLIDGLRHERNLCDHTCTLALGGYTCYASRSLNPDIQSGTLAPATQVLEWLKHSVDGLRMARDEFLSRGQLDSHCKRYKIPEEAKAVLREALQVDVVRVNLFGGNTEMHPDLLQIIVELKKRGLQVNLTTTGRRLMTKPDFAQQLIDSGLDLLALSADDFEPKMLAELLKLEPDEIKRRWQESMRAEPSYGQQQKVYEAVWCAMLARDNDSFPFLLFNMVMSRANMADVRGIIEQLERSFPKLIMNPFVAQAGHYGGMDFFTPELLTQLGTLADWFHERILKGERFFRRVHYWWAIKAALSTFHGNPAEAARVVDHLWRCYRAPGADRYFQVGRSNGLIPDDQRHPGGRPGCFWNQNTVTDGTQIKNSHHVLWYLTGGMRNLATVAGGKACVGCSMPRLMLDLITTQAGLDPRIIPAFLALRKKDVGF